MNRLIVLKDPQYKNVIENISWCKKTYIFRKIYGFTGNLQLSLKLFIFILDFATWIALFKLSLLNEFVFIKSKYQLTEQQVILMTD